MQNNMKIKNSSLHIIFYWISSILFIGSSILIQFSPIFIAFSIFLFIAIVALTHSLEDFADDWRLMKKTNKLSGEINYAIQFLYHGYWYNKTGRYGCYSEDKFKQAELKVKQLKGLEEIKEEIIVLDDRS